MKNKLKDLNDHLFCEIERLGDEELVGEKLQQEISRADAITKVAAQIINNGNLVLRACVAKDSAIDNLKLPEQLVG